MKPDSQYHTRKGFTLVALLVIIAVLAILAAMLLPALAASKKKSSRLGCVNNLKQAGLAVRIWSGDNGDKYPMEVPSNLGGSKEFTTGADVFRHFLVMSNELSTPRILVCPNDDRMAAADFAHLKNQNVSYFVGLDASETNPQMLLAGDRNITGGSAPEKGILKLVPGGPAGWTAAIHNHNGNVALADGSVQSFSDSGLKEAVKNSGDPTNTWRIALPE
jgi:prepilin-type processing-associated H-X9-DG protein